MVLETAGRALKRWTIWIHQLYNSLRTNSTNPESKWRTTASTRILLDNVVCEWRSVSSAK